MKTNDEILADIIREKPEYADYLNYIQSVKQATDENGLMALIIQHRPSPLVMAMVLAQFTLEGYNENPRAEPKAVADKVKQEFMEALAEKLIFDATAGGSKPMPSC